MEYFWKENKRFVLAVGGGLAFLLLYQSLVLGKIRGAAELADRTRRNKKAEIEKKMAQGVPTDETLSAARRDRDNNRKVLAGMAPDTAFTLPERFLKPKRDVKAYYDNLKIELTNQLNEKATAGRVAFPQNLGLPEDVTEENASEMLLRLAVVERLVGLCIDAECEKIESVNALHGADQDERTSKKSKFLTKYSVFVRFHGKAESVFKVIHGAQKKGSYLAVTQFEMSRPDATKDVFEASLGAALLKVDDKGTMDAP
ncbi:MAG: hypothetical protein JO332_10285 [Planctomycetaceae bacterium]|nr:hypothetical protein [Planctomycetaceae bacterium]